MPRPANQRADGLPVRWSYQDEACDYLQGIGDENRLWVQIVAKAKKMTSEEYVDAFIAMEPARNNNQGPVTWDLRDDILVRDQHRCGICGTNEGPMHIDHKHPRSRGGETVLKNLWTLCRHCNLSKGARTVEEFVEARAAR